jgi:hypothetical protein
MRTILVLIAYLSAGSVALSQTAVTCAPGTESYCEAWCSHAGGGMSSNPDGSTTCTVYAAAMEAALSTPMKVENIAKLKSVLNNLELSVRTRPSPR